MEYQNIDKEIYQRNEIKRRVRPQYWALISIVLGFIGLGLYLYNPDSGLAIGLLGWGIFSVLTLFCYWIFGDSHAPYYKPSKHLLTREYFYYPTSSLSQLISALETNNEEQLAMVKRTANPQLVLVRYSDDDEQIIYSQIKQSEGNHEVPITNIYTNVISK